MASFRVAWVDLVSRSAKVEAESKEEALRIVLEGELDSRFFQEEYSEYHQEPYIEGEDN